MSFSDYMIVLLLIAGGMLMVMLILQRNIRRAKYVEQTIDMVRREMEHLLMQLNNAADQQITLIDDRSQQLKQLLARSQKTIKLLQKETEKNALSATTYKNLLKQPPPPSPAVVEAPKEERPMYQRIMTHVTEGMSADQIAKKLSVSVSEVELAISLQKAQEPFDITPPAQ